MAANTGEPALAKSDTIPLSVPGKQIAAPISHAVPSNVNAGRSQQQHQRLASPNHGRRGITMTGGANNLMTSNNGAQGANTAQFEANLLHQHQHPYQQHSHHHQIQPSAASKRSSATKSSSASPLSMSSSTSSSASASSSPSATYSASSSPANTIHMPVSKPINTSNGNSPRSTSVQKGSTDSLRYEYDDHYFLTDPDEFIYEFYPLSPEWQLIKTRPITLAEFEQLPFVRSLFFKYGLYFPQHDIRSVLHTDSSGATTIKIGMPTHMIPSLIFHYNLKYYESDLEHYEGVSLKRFVMQSVESG